MGGEQRDARPLSRQAELQRGAKCCTVMCMEAGRAGHKGVHSHDSRTMGEQSCWLGVRWGRESKGFTSMGEYGYRGLRQMRSYTTLLQVQQEEAQP